jgi:hypothetical protein
MRGLVLLAALMVSPIFAAAGQSVTLTGLGTGPCGTWTAVRHDRKAADAEQWVVGFLSGAAVFSKDLAPLNGVDADAVWAWIDRYCRAHPLDALSEAGKSFVVAHPG